MPSETSLTGLPRRHMLVLLATLTACAAGSSPSRTVQDFYRALDEGRISDAMKLLTGIPVGMESKIQVALGVFSESLKAEGGLASVDVASEDVNGEGAKVTYKLSTRNPGDKPKVGNGKTQTQALQKIDKQWRIVLR